MPYLFLIIAPKAPIRTGTKPPGEARGMASASAVATVTAFFAESYQPLSSFRTKPCSRIGVFLLGEKRGTAGMGNFSRRNLAIWLLIAGLVAGWGWDHVRTTGMLRRTVESEQYFRERLFECLREYKGDLKGPKGVPADVEER